VILLKQRENRGLGTRELLEKIYSQEEEHLFKFQEYADMKDESEGLEPPLSEWRKISPMIFS